MKKHSLRRPVLMLLAATLAPGLAWSQEAAKSTTTTTTEDDELIVLSPFNVDTSKDKGYKATNSTSGTRLNTAIKDVPLNLEVITNDFMRDTGAKNLREALRYSAGVVLESQADAFTDDDSNIASSGANDPRGVTRREGDSTIKLRGFVIDQVLRDGFRRQYSADWINIARTEVLRGPSALLYGVGSLGGVINFFPKLPEYTPKTSLGVTIGNYNFIRAEFDTTAPMGTSSWKPAFRVTGAYQQRGDYTEYFRERHWVIAPVFTIKPFKGTTVIFDNEFGYQNQEGVGFQNLRSNIGQQADSAGRNAQWLTDTSGGLIETRTFRWSGKDPYMRGPYRNNIFDIQQQVGENLWLKAGVAQSRAVFDSRQINAHVSSGTLESTAGMADPNNYYAYGTTTIGGSTIPIRAALLSGASPTDVFNNRSTNSARLDRLYGYTESNIFNTIGTNTGPQFNDKSMIIYRWDDQDRDELRDQFRADATYKLDLGKYGRHQFVVGTQYMKMKTTKDISGSAYGYTNLTTRAVTSVQDWQRFNFKNPGDYAPFTYGKQGDGAPDVPTYKLYHDLENTWDAGYYGVYQGQFFNDRITLIGGARWDRSDANTRRSFIYEKGHKDALTGRGTDGTSGGVPTATSPQLGVSVKITKDLSIFADYSEGVVPNPYAADGNGNMLKPTKAKSKEVGVKFDLLDGRISGTISAYEIKREGQPKYVWWAPNPWKSKQDGWDTNLPNAVVGDFATPDAMWAVVHSTQGMNTTQGLALAKRIWSPGWWPLLNEVFAAATPSAAYNGPEGSRFWTWDLTGLAYSANVNTANYDPNYTGNLWFPLFNLADPDVAKAFDAIAAVPGWKGNYGTNGGNTFRWADGSRGYTNGPGSSGAYVPMNDQSRGWDASFIFTPNDSLQVVLNFAHVDRVVTTSTYNFVKLGYWPAGAWMQTDPNFGTYSPTRTTLQAYGDRADSSTYRVIVPDYNNPVDDTPRNSASTWIKYNFDQTVPSLKGWTVGLGGQWEDKRMWFTGFSGSNVVLRSGSQDGASQTNLVKFYTKERYVLNMMVEYRTKISNKYNLRLALNGDNVLDDQKRYGLVYAPGSTYRFSTGLDF